MNKVNPFPDSILPSHPPLPDWFVQRPGMIGCGVSPMSLILTMPCQVMAHNVAFEFWVALVVLILASSGPAGMLD